MKSNYFISRDMQSGEVVYIEYNKDGYKISPKAKKKDAIEVNKIIFVSPKLTEKLIKKKINNKISKLLLELNTFYDENDEDSESEETRVRDMLKEAERLKLNIINNYKKYLDSKYTGLSLKKIQIIIDGYRSREQVIIDKKKEQFFAQLLSNSEYMYEEQNEIKQGRGR